MELSGSALKRTVFKPHFCNRFVTQAIGYLSGPCVGTTMAAEMLSFPLANIPS